MLTFWRANNAGYTSNFLKAGKYTKDEIEQNLSYYNNGYFDKGKFVPDNVAVPCEEFENEAIKVVHIEKSDNHYKYWNYIGNRLELPTSKESFFTLWHVINGHTSLLSNPWVWCYTFEKIEKPENI